MTPDKSIVSMIEKEAEGLYEIRGQAEYESLEEYDNFRSRQLARQLAYIAGRSVSIESEKAKDERIKKLKEKLGKSIEIIKQWHNADEVWDIYFNNAPEMKSIRELLNNK